MKSDEPITLTGPEAAAYTEFRSAALVVALAQAALNDASAKFRDAMGRLGQAIQAAAPAANG